MTPSRAWTALVLVLVFAVALPAHARDKEPSCKWASTVQGPRLDASESHLLAPVEVAAVHAALAEHLPFGLPPAARHGQGEHLLASEAFVVWYDDDLRLPLWTAHHLTRAMVEAYQVREDSFRSDPRLDPDDRSTCRDYQEPLFDQGHMVSNADMAAFIWTMDLSFLMSNMTPQYCEFNRGPWLALESTSRDWAMDAGEVWVVSGVVLDRDGVPGRDPDDDAWRMKGLDGARVAIPSAQYRIVVRRSADGKGYDTLTFLLPHARRKVAADEMAAWLADHVSTLEAVEAASGFRFLARHATQASAVWPHPPGSLAPFYGRCATRADR